MIETHSAGLSKVFIKTTDSSLWSHHQQRERNVQIINKQTKQPAIQLNLSKTASYTFKSK